MSQVLSPLALRRLRPLEYRRHACNSGNNATAAATPQYASTFLLRDYRRRMIRPANSGWPYPRADVNVVDLPSAPALALEPAGRQRPRAAAWCVVPVVFACGCFERVWALEGASCNACNALGIKAFAGHLPPHDKIELERPTLRSKCFRERTPRISSIGSYPMGA